MKKINKLSAAALIAAVGIFSSTAALAAVNPTVVLDNRTVEFADQKPVITEDEGRTLVPVRGIFEQMGATVAWFPEERAVSVVSSDNLTKIILRVDNSEMVVRRYKGLIEYDEEKITLDAAPRIMNDRTMIPLRVISETLKANVEWDAENYVITITTAPTSSDTQNTDTQTQPTEDKRVKMSISVDKEDVKAGDEVLVSVNVGNVADKNVKITSATARILYDKTKFEYVGFAPVVDGAEANAVSADNGNYNDNSAKVTYVTLDAKKAMTDGSVAVVKFKALTDEGGSFALANTVSSSTGCDTYFAVMDENGKDISYESDKDLFIDLAPVEVK